MATRTENQWKIQLPKPSTYSRQRVMSCFASIVLVIILVLQSSVFAQNTDVGTSTPSREPDVRFAIMTSDNSDFFELDLQDGQTSAVEGRILNAGSEQVSLRLYVASALSAINGGFLAGDSGDELLGAAQWVSLATSEVDLDPDQSLEFTFDVEVPIDTPPGQYVSAIVAETVDTLPVPGSDTFDHRIRYAIALVVNVPGETHVDFQMGSPYLERHVMFIPVSNYGNHLIRPEGEIIMLDSEGEVVLSAPVALGSIYSETETLLAISLPPQLAGGEYVLDVNLTDPASGATAEIADEVFIIPLTGESVGVELTMSSVEPNDAEITFANVNLSLQNNGDEISASSVVMGVFRDGILLEEFPIATNQIMLRGENVYEARYIPIDMWESGTYTFTLSVLAVDPHSGQKVELLNQSIGSEIVVP